MIAPKWGVMWNSALAALYDRFCALSAKHYDTHFISGCYDSHASSCPVYF